MSTCVDMNIQFTKCPAEKPFDVNILPTELPTFLTYQPDFEAMETLKGKFGFVENIIVVGHGGSVSSFFGIYEALRYQYTNAFKSANKMTLKDAYVLSTIDPDYISHLKTKLSRSRTLVVAISKSGQDTTQLEMLSQFWDFPTLVITEKDTTLYEIAQKKGWDFFEHPAIGGRFTGLTEVALLPALLCGIDAKAVFESGRAFHKQFSLANSAFSLASTLWELEKSEIVDVFVAFYSHYLTKFSWLITQLVHESFGKDGLGQTFICLEAPEWQHHTLQRVLGGKKNSAVVFIEQEKFATEIMSKFESIGDIAIRDHELNDISDVQLSHTVKFERDAVSSELSQRGIPSMNLQFLDVSPQSVGKFIAFWQMFAVYSAILREVNPFDQPAVESGKDASFKMRLHKN